MAETKCNKTKIVKVEVEILNETIALKSNKELPPLLKLELEKSIEVVNRLVREKEISLDQIDLSSLVFPAEDEASSRRGVPCNANRIENHWWGVTVYLSEDMILNITMGEVPATGIATMLGGPLALAIGAALVALSTALAAACGPCGVEVQFTWALVPKKIKRRK